MMRRIRMCLVLPLALCVLAVSALGAAASPFADIDIPEVTALAERGLMNGVGNGDFAPDAPMTRAMLATVLFRLAGENAADYTETPLADAPADSWYGPAAFWAWQAGLMGAEGLDFRPDAAVTGGDVRAVLRRYTGGFAPGPDDGGEALTRLRAAKILRPFADAAPEAPLTVAALTAANQGTEALFGENGRYSFTNTGRIAAQEPFTDRYDAALTDGKLQFVVRLDNGDTYAYRESGLFLKRADGGMERAVMAEEHTAAVLGMAAHDGVLSYTPEERIVDIAAGEAATTVTTEQALENGGKLEYVYTLDRGSLRLSRMAAREYAADGGMTGEIVTAMAYGEADVSAPWADALETPQNPRVCTVVRDPGGENETTHTYETTQGTYFSFYEVPGYGYFQDAAGTVPLSGDGEPRGDVTVYLIADPTPAT